MSLYLILMFSCSEYSINLGKDRNAGENGGYGFLEQDIWGYPPENACETFWDEEQNSSIPTELSVIDGCAREPVVGLLDAVLEWEIELFGNYSEYGEIVMAPVIGQLSDDNGDGLITWEDTPDIVVVSDDGGLIPNKHGILRILSGSDGTELRSVNRSDYGTTQVYAYRYGNVALGDIDNDGLPDIVTLADVVAGGGPPPDQDPNEPTDDTAPPQPSSEGGGGSMEECEEEEEEQPPPEPSDNPILPPPPTTTTTPEPDDSGTTGGGGGDDAGDPCAPTTDTAPPLPPEPSQEPSAGPIEEPPLIGCRLVAYDHELNVKWLSMPFTENCGGHAPALADLEGDGEVEVVVGSTIFRGLTGDIRAVGEGDVGKFDAYAEMGMNSIIVDLDVDGVQEIIAGRSVYSPTGREICRGEGPMDGFTAAADLDLDGMGEFVVVGNQRAIVYDTDCSILAMWPLQGGGTGGPPTIADYDGDLMPEIGLVDAHTYSVYQPDGTVEWSAPVTDASSHATGSLVFDFEGDGFPEVVYADELALWVFDGRNGQVRLRDDGHNSRTLHEYPTVADIDNDGSVEIVVTNGGSHYDNNSTGIFAIGSANNSWQRGRQVWNQHAYSITNINDDLSIPERPRSNWPEYNNFRSGDMNPVSGSAAPDAVPMASYCTLECYMDRIELKVHIGNQGPATLRSGIAIRISTEHGNGSEITLAEQLTTDMITSKAVSEPFVFAIPIDEIGNSKLIIDVDAGDYVNECTEGNNRIVLDDVQCD